MRFNLTPRVGRRQVILAFPVLAIVAMNVPAQAQFNGDPFDPFRASFRSSTLPMANQFAPGQARSVTPPGMGSVPGIGTPWDSSFGLQSITPPPVSRFERFDSDLLSPSNDVYRRYDADFGRVYRPNAEADEQFTRLQEARRELYLQASRETDPQKRAELMRRYQDLSRRISLGMTPTPARDTAATKTGRDARSTQDAGAVGPAGLPRTVRSYDDLARWSRVINREATAVGIVRPESN